MPTVGANGAAVKAQSSRDSALTWEVPPSLNEPAKDARAAEFKLAYRYVARLHISKLVEQLLAAESVASPEAWASILPDLAREAADLISPTEMHSAGFSDPREVIKVKRVLVSGVGVDEVAAEISGCVVDGIVCRGHLAHKRMRSLIQTPRIVTISGVLEYERQYDKLSSFDALMDTERQHLRAKVEAVMAAQPDVVLVEGGVARHAQELLLEAGVSLVMHVKPKLLQRIARCVGSVVQPVAGSVPLALESVGTCEEFEVRWSSEPEETTLEVVESSVSAVEAAVVTPPPPPLIFFRGCKRGLDCSIVLEGTNEEELAKVKRVAASAAYAAYWNILEIEFLTTQLLAVAACEGPLQDAGQRWLGRTAAGASATQAENRRAKEIQGVRTIDKPIWSPSPHISAYEEPGKGIRDSELPCPAFSEAQALWLSISCRNPAKAIVCETPHLHSMHYYAEGDMTLADFLSAAAPANRKCPHPSCGDGAALHLRSFMHGNSLVTLSSFHMAAGQKLEGASEGQVWFWLRPIGVAAGQAPLPSTHRVALPPEAACMSFAHLLALLLDARDMQVEGVDLQHGFVRYLGLGNSIICLHHTKISPYTVRLPPPVVHVAPTEQAKWLGDEIKQLVEEADEVFSAIQENLSRKPLVHLQPEAVEECGEVLASLRESYMSMVLKVQAAMAQNQEVLPTINQLRRYLMLVAQQWDSMLTQSSTDLAAAAAAGSRLIEGAEGPTGDQAAAAAQHARTDSNSSSVHHDDQLRPTVPPIRFLAPKLVDTECDAVPGELVSQGEVIPTGLVARYVSLFEDVDQASKDSGSPTRSSSVAVVDEEASDVPSWERAYRRPSTTIDLRRIRTEEAFSPVRSADKLLPEDLDGKLEDLRVQLERVKCTSEDTAERAGTQRSAAASDSQLSQKLVKGRPLLPNGPGQAPVTIFDNEPTSVVAYFLSTRQYHEYVEEAAETCLDSVAENAPVEKEAMGTATKGDAGILRTSLQLDCQMLAEDIVPSPSNNRARFSMTAYYAPHFAAFRRTCIEGGEAAFLASIARCRPWSVQGGKSNVFFAKTRDDRYVIKQLTRAEKQSILAFAPNYFRYVHDVLTDERRTCLSKIFGVYQVSVESYGAKALPGKDGTIDFLIMENLFHGCEVDAIYDLKGSVRDRYANGSQNKNSLVVLLDENLRELNQASPTLMSPLAFAHLQQSLFDDINFLASLDVMDYSLLVGFDKTRRELVVGLVDFVRQYTWDKQVESWVKQSGLLGGAGKEPTIISPRQYAKRFRSAMFSYFTVVPLLGEPLNIEED